MASAGLELGHSSSQGNLQVGSAGGRAAASLAVLHPSETSFNMVNLLIAKSTHAITPIRTHHAQKGEDLYECTHGTQARTRRRNLRRHISDSYRRRHPRPILSSTTTMRNLRTHSNILRTNSMIHACGTRQVRRDKPKLFTHRQGQQVYPLQPLQQSATQHPSHPSRPQQHHGSPRSQQSLPQHHPSQSNLQSTPKAEPTEVPRGRSPLLNPGSMTNPPSSASEPLRQKSESPKQGGSSSSQTTTLFHSYILDYLQRAGFLTTAAAFLSEKPDVSTFPLESGRHYPARSRRDSSSMRAAASNLASPAGLTIPVSHKSPISAPLFRSESGSSPVSPNQQGVSNHSTVESTTSSNSTTSHFGFDGANSAVGGDDERPSPGDEFKRDSEPELALDDTIPAAAVEHEVEAGFLYEWFHVFHDVHSARMGTGGSASARTVVESNLAAPTIGKRIQTFVQRRPAEQILRPTQVVSAQSMTASPKRYVQAQPRPQLLARRPSQLQGPAGRLAQPGMVSGRPTMTRTSSLNGAPVTPIQAGHAQPLSRQNSQHLLIQQQRENHARQQALHGRQKLHQVQLEQMHLQNQMLESPKQSQPNASNMSVPGPTSSGVSGYAADRLARSSESFGNYNAANTNSQRSQRAQEPLQPEYNESSPQPIPAGSRYVLREPVTNGNAPYLRVESAGKPGLQRTYSQPHAQQLSSNQQDKLMPPPQAIGRPPINRSLSASLVEDDNPNSTVPVGLPTQSTKRRRDSVLDSSTLGADSREVKKARSYTDLSSQGQRSTTGKSPLAQELDFSAQSGDLPANATSTRSPAAGLESPVKKTVEEIDLTAPSPLPGPPHQLGLVETVEVDVSLQDTEALLASLEDMERKSRSGELEDLSSGAVTGPTMTDAELDAFFAQSMKAVDDPDFANVAIEKEPPISIPENADFDFSEYNSFFGADAASYDPTTFDLTV
ncbi:LisH domain-containing protein [Sporobolomyces koalae]|uniref:LisH domain-containing protein n=1 Tax=Sporobolomyces koalae TaxID=500713 RepID=UPI003170456D